MHALCEVPWRLAGIVARDLSLLGRQGMTGFLECSCSGTWPGCVAPGGLLPVRLSLESKADDASNAMCR